jgi:hypothetical protein
MYLQGRVDGPGLRGTIRVEGVPAEGTITIVGLDNPPDNTPRRSHPVLGDYYRILSPGTYDVRFEVDGWDPILVEDVTVTRYVTLDADFESSSTSEGGTTILAGFAVFPNPILPGDNVAFHLPNGSENLSLQIFDTSGRLVADLSAEIQGSQGAVTWRPNSRNLTSGIYYARLRAGEIEEVRRFVSLIH